jgi:condensin complex subunit 1
MLNLIWSKEKSVKEEVILAYYTLYLNQQEQPANKIAKNLINIMMDSDLTEATSLEEVIYN